MLAKLNPVPPAQHTQETLLADILPWLILLLGIVVAGGILIYWARRTLTEQRSSGTGDAGFTLHELRALHDKGELSTEEFERARTALIGAFQSTTGPAASETNDTDPDSDDDDSSAADEPEASDNDRTT